MKNWKRWRHPIAVVNVAYIAIILSLGLLLWSGWKVYREVQHLESATYQTQRMLIQLSRLDEKLTRTARTAVVTGDSRWARAYEAAGWDMDRVLAELQQVPGPGADSIRVGLARVHTLNDSLVLVERAAILDRDRTERSDGGLNLLSSNAYNRQKDQITREMHRVTDWIGEDLSRSRDRLTGRMAWIGVLLALLILAGFLMRTITVGVLRTYIRMREETETGLVEARQRAEEANRAKSEFLSRMSHELRTPLNAILGFGQLLEAEVEREDDREALEQILKAGRHLLALIDEVLDLASIEAGRVTLSIEPIAVSSLVQESLALVAPTARGSGVLLSFQPADDLHAWADQQRLKQVLLNLLSNAIKYNRPGGRVQVEVRQEGERVRVSVADTGIGIPRHVQERLFVPFDRAGAEQRTLASGTGLGLALSKSLVELMGGEIGMRSVEGEGATFWVLLTAAEGSHETEAPPSAPSAPAASLRQTRVLYIEDNLSNLRLVERVLSRRPGTQIISAMQGTLGLEMAQHHRPDVVLLDINLPDIPGSEVLRRLRADPDLRSTPVIVISADATEKTRRELLQLGAHNYLTKPLDLKSFYQALESARVL